MAQFNQIEASAPGAHCMPSPQSKLCMSCENHNTAGKWWPIAGAKPCTKGSNLTTNSAWQCIAALGVNLDQANLTRTKPLAIEPIGKGSYHGRKCTLELLPQ